MARSYKKNPVYKGNVKGSKRQANKKVKALRKQNPDAIGQNGGYKKVYDQWEISDYLSRVSEKEWENMYKKYLNSCQDWKIKIASECTLEQWMQRWRKYYKRK